MPYHLARLIIALVLAIPVALQAQSDSARLRNDWAWLDRYRAENAALPPASAERVVFMGNSITEAWARLFPTLFPGKDYIGRGISGQTTPQMLVRFRQDVVALEPRVVVILAGTNDIAGNTGPSTVAMIQDNIAAMAEMARANGIRVVLASVLPVDDYPWKRGLDPAPKIMAINAWMKQYAAGHGAVYLDLHSPMQNERHGMKAELAYDGVHPTEAGFRLMSPLTERAIASALALPVQVTQRPDSSAPVVAIRSPRTPLPTEAASAGVTKFSFIAYGDTRGRRDGTNEQYEHWLVVESMLRTIKAMENGPDPVRFVLQSGDAVVNGRDPRQWNVSFVGLINRITTEGGVPYFLAPGNHDVTGSEDLANPGRLTGLGNYLRAVSQLIPPDRNARRLDGYPTYAFGYGNTFVLAFDSNIATDSTQYAWIKSQLERLDRRRYQNLIAFFHHPVYSSGPHGGSNVERPTIALRDRYMPLFRKHGVDLLLAGHEHLFEHWVERYRDSTGRTRRLDQIVSGGGGAPLYPYFGEPDLRAYRAAGGADSVRVQHLVRPGMDPGDNAYHYLVVHVDGPRISVEVIGVDWGRGFAPYRSTRATLSDSIPPDGA